MEVFAVYMCFAPDGAMNEPGNNHNPFHFREGAPQRFTPSATPIKRDFQHRFTPSATPVKRDFQHRFTPSVTPVRRDSQPNNPYIVRMCHNTNCKWAWHAMPLHFNRHVMPYRYELIILFYTVFATDSFIDFVGDARPHPSIALQQFIALISLWM